jgi:hypothetical protein
MEGWNVIEEDPEFLIQLLGSYDVVKGMFWSEPDVPMSLARVPMEM